MKPTALGLLLILCAGCAATEPKLMFEKTGSTEAQAKKDQAACVRASVTGEDQVVANILTLDREAYRRCMEGRGYTLRTQL
jgi:hypothetical protein